MKNKDKQPMVSVVVPVYNRKQTIRRCLDSLIKQNLQNIEIIVIDDGSTDETAVILKEYISMDSRIVFLQQENRGVSAARNAGIIAASGKYVMFVDSDDYVHVNYCTIMYDEIKSDKFDLVICGFECVKSDGTSESKRLEQDIEGDIQTVFHQAWLADLLFYPWNKIYIRDKIIDYFPEDMIYSEDQVFNLKYIEQCGKIKLRKDVLYYYMDTDEDYGRLTKSKSLKSIQDLVRTHLETYKYVKKNISEESGNHIGYSEVLTGLERLYRYSKDYKKFHCGFCDLRESILLEYARTIPAKGIKYRLVRWLVLFNMSWPFYVGYKCRR